MMKWKSIETAPKDETEFLGCDETGFIDKTWVGWQCGDEQVYVHADWVSWTPIYWMPLPKPPKI